MSTISLQNCLPAQIDWRWRATTHLKIMFRKGNKNIWKGLISEVILGLKINVGKSWKKFW